MTFTLLLALCLDFQNIQPATRVPIPRDIYIVESLTPTQDGGFILLDAKSFVLLKMTPDGAITKSGKKGQGPGEFNNPWAVTTSGGTVYVADYQTIHVFDQETLSFIKRIPTDNNAMEISFYDNELFLATSKYPSKGFGMQVLNDKGDLLRTLYEHRVPNAPEEMKIPYFDQGSDGTLYFLHHQEYRIDILDPKGKKIHDLRVALTPRYKPATSLAKVEKKYGATMASWKRWKSQWSVSSRIAIVKDRYLWVCFEELQEDLRNTKYFVEIYDLKTSEKIVSWREMPGRLYDGGSQAYFVSEIEGNQGGDYDLEIVGYSVKP